MVLLLCSSYPRFKKPMNGITGYSDLFLCIGIILLLSGVLSILLMSILLKVKNKGLLIALFSLFLIESWFKYGLVNFLVFSIESKIELKLFAGQCLG